MKQLDKVEVEKMRQLADFLETVPPEDFDLGNWQDREERPRKTTLFGLIERDPGCGFSGCAVGWAAFSGIFPGLGLSPHPAHHGSMEPSYKGHTNWSAVRKLFGVSQNHAELLFYSMRYRDKRPVTPGMVADRLRQVARIVEVLRKKPVERKVKLRLVA